MSTAPKQHSPGFLALVEDAKTRVREIDTAALQRMRAEGKPHRLLDVREDNEWAAGHAADAEHLSKGVLERDIESRVPDKSETLVLYCGGGFRSALAVDSLQKMGYENVLSLAGGWRAIQEAGMEAKG